jgi:hypothetical protein
MTRRQIVLFLLTSLTVLMAATPLAHASGGTLTVVKNGNGHVFSAPEGIDCGTDCSEHYPAVPGDCAPQYPTCNEPQEITLTAEQTAPGWAFAGWGGACSGATGSCDLLMSIDRTVQASFVDVQAPTVDLTTPNTNGIPVRGIVTLRATASDNDRVDRVQFKLGQTVLGADTTAPYALDVDTTKAPFADGSQTITAQALDASGHSASVNRPLILDNTAPSVTFDLPAHSASHSVTAHISVDEAVTWRCNLDGTLVPCAPPEFTVTNLADGFHFVGVTATDPAGNHGGTAKYVEVDATAPHVELSGPSGTIPRAPVSYSFTSTDAHQVAAQCSIDGHPYFGCGSPTNLGAPAPGAHTFDLRVTDMFGNRTAVHREFTVSAPTTPPATDPPATDPPATDPPATTPPAADPPATDQSDSGQVEAPADTAAPDTRITTAPAKRVAKRKVRFGFASTEAGSRFECSLDRAAWSACASPQTLKVKRGKHRLAVRAIDAAGNADASPATAKFRIGRRR